VIATSLADVFFFSRRFDEAIAKLRRVIEMEPTFAPARNDLARSLVQAGRPKEAIEEFWPRPASGATQRPGRAKAPARPGARATRAPCSTTHERARDHRFVARDRRHPHRSASTAKRSVNGCACREHDRALGGSGCTAVRPLR
jgi:hypothetical protein